MFCFHRHQSFKPNNIPSSFTPNHLLNNESQNGHPFIHPQLQQQQQLLSNKSPNHMLMSVPLSGVPSQLTKNFNNNQTVQTVNQSSQLHQTSSHFPGQLHPYLHSISQQSDKDKLNSLEKSQSLPPSVNLYINSPIILDNKRPKLNTEQNKSYNPLKIDTFYDLKKGGVYYPQVEAISPTNLEDKNGEHRNSRKDEILQSLEKLDRDIKQTESKISKARKQQKELEALTNSSNKQNQTENLEQNDLKQLSTTQQVYTENKKKAEESQRKLDNIRPLTIAVSLLIIWSYDFIELILNRYFFHPASL